jgi:hypothetical protein
MIVRSYTKVQGINNNKIMLKVAQNGQRPKFGHWIF